MTNRAKDATLTLRIEPRLIARVKREAARRDCSIATVVREALRVYFRRMIFRIRFQQKGAHVHCRLFQTTAPGHTWQKNGELTFDEAGWEAFAVLLVGRVEMLPEETGEA